MRRQLLPVAIAICVAAAGPASASEQSPSGKVAVVAERSQPGGMEQVALVFEGEKVTLTRNSNFLDSPASKAVLGRFESELTPALRGELDQLRHFQERLARAKSPPPRSESPHATHFYLGEAEIPAGSSYLAPIEALLSHAIGRGNWQPVEAIEVSLRKEPGLDARKLGGKVGTKWEFPSQICREMGKGSFRCQVAGYGTAYLKRGK